MERLSLATVLAEGRLTDFAAQAQAAGIGPADQAQFDALALVWIQDFHLSEVWFKVWMERFVVTDAQWAKMAPHGLGKPTDPGRGGRNNRLFREAVLWIVRTGSRWRDLPAVFGNGSTAFRRFRDWREADVFTRLFEACSDDTDMEYACVDATRTVSDQIGSETALYILGWPRFLNRQVVYLTGKRTIVKLHRHGQGAKGGLKARPLVAPKPA